MLPIEPLSPRSAQTLPRLWLAEISRQLSPPADSDESEQPELTRIERDWQAWVEAIFARRYLRNVRGERVGFADHHIAMWEWAWQIERGVASRPLVVILARGGAKSTTAEMIAAMWGARRARRYLL